MKDNNLLKPFYLKIYHTIIAICRSIFNAGFEQTTLFIYKTGRVANSIFWIGQVRYKRTPAIYRITTMRAYLQQSGNEQAYSKIFGEETVRVYGPKFYPGTQATAMVTRPEIYYSVLESVTVIGASNVIVGDCDTVIYEELEKADIHRQSFESPLTPFVARDRMILDSTPSPLVIEKGISLCGRGCENLYHWLYEYIARLKILEFVDAKYATWPILVDERLRDIPQLIEILEHYAPDREYIFVKYGHRVQVRKLLYLSLSVWIPFNFRKGEVCKVEDCIISPLAVDFIRSKMIAIPNHTASKRIFISRKNFPERRGINEKEVIDMLQPYGFEVVYAEHLSFAEQMSIFQDAEIVIGVTGAALSNIVFCSPGTLVICLISAKLQLGIFSNIANYLNLDLVYLAGTGDVTFKNIHKDFNVDLNALNSILTSLSERLNHQTQVN